MILLIGYIFADIWVGVLLLTRLSVSYYFQMSLITIFVFIAKINLKQNGKCYVRLFF